jgi:hypothetical protein
VPQAQNNPRSETGLPALKLCQHLADEAEELVGIIVDLAIELLGQS